MELSAGNSPPPSQHSNVLLSPLLIAGGILSAVALLLLAFHLILKYLRPSPPSEKPFRENVDEVLRSIPSQRLAAQISPTECSVCLSDVKEGQRVRILPSCSHAFHALCIDAWLRTRLNCPLCRSPLQQPSSISYAV